MLSRRAIAYRSGFWFCLIMLLVLFACALTGVDRSDGGGLDWSRTWFCLAATYTLVTHLNVLAWVYCGLTFLATIHFLERARGKTGMWSFLLFCIPSVAMLFLVATAITCMCEVEYVVRFDVFLCDPDLCLYFPSGKLGYYRGGFSPLRFIALALAVNVPLWLVLAMRSWRPIRREAAN